MKMGEVAMCVEKVQHPETSISKERARQIVPKALRKLRHPARVSRIVQALNTISN
jgi:DNA-directed RNA polymerase sigma subunit (sigma70/sigma32)